ncbi:ER degradation-enhancing alpha-mannosidase-like protein 1 isoform X2 [Dysidea avara]|uniref:ER degradation-enhancing alpha-mannosidase-like protein 1 isoform X2 n=1 Tax=Dysidea avara TaxID=196820 RepID=UPI00331B6F64
MMQNLVRLWITAIAMNIISRLLFPQLILLFTQIREGWVNTPVSPLIHKPFPEELRLAFRDRARRMFYDAYDNYIRHAFPMDELNPVNCSGRGRDWNNPDNININDALGDYSLTLVDALDSLAVMGNYSEFQRAVKLVIDNVSFEKCSTVQVFEANIRVLGALLSAHLLMMDEEQPFGPLTPEWYNNELLELAHELGIRLITAFDDSKLGIPHPRVNLCMGVPVNGSTHTCTAGAGSLVLEFGLLSRLVGDPVFEMKARRAVKVLWDHRDPVTGLVGNTLDIQTVQWESNLAGIGAGMDSFYEYLLKSYVMFGDPDDLYMFNEFYHSIMRYLKKGRACSQWLPGLTNAPHYVNIDMTSGKISNYWTDSLSAFFAGLQVLIGDISEAVCTHAFFYSIWRRYQSLPERFDWKSKQPVVFFYPLRPELIESTYLLYQATRNPFYLYVGSDILESLEKHARNKCGYSTIHNVLDKSHEDRMESFFLSETSKYLYLLFDKENIVNKRASQYLFTTEGHIIKLDPIFRKPWVDYEGWLDSSTLDMTGSCLKNSTCGRQHSSKDCGASKMQCESLHFPHWYDLPLSREELGQIEALVGLHDT